MYECGQYSSLPAHSASSSLSSLLSAFSISSLDGSVTGKYPTKRMSKTMASPEHVAEELRAEAIKKMNINDYQGACKLLNQAKKVFPALMNIDIMLFVSNLLRTAEYVKPHFGVDWHQMLSLPRSASFSITETRFNYFISHVEAIKDDFPCADIARGIMTTELLAISREERNKGHGNESFQPISQSVGTVNVTGKSNTSGDLKGKPSFIECSNKIITENANAAANNKNTAGSLKKKLPSLECSSEIVSLSCSSAELCKTRGNIEVDLNRSFLGSKFQDVDDGRHLQEKMVVYAKKKEKKLDGSMKMVTSENQTSDTTLTKLKAGKTDVEGIDECESNYNLAGACWLAKSEKLVNKTSSCSDFSMEQSIADPKIFLLEAMPQNPHYKILNGMSDEFRHPIILGIEESFTVVAQQICKLFVTEDVEYSIDNITNQLIFLESMGYDVHKLRASLEELIRTKEKKEVLMKDSQMKDNELKDWMVEREGSESKNRRARSWIAEEEQKLQRLESSFAAKEDDVKLHKDREGEMEQRRIKWKEQCDRLDSEIEATAMLPW